MSPKPRRRQRAAARRACRPSLHAGFGAATRAVFAYDERLRLLPSYLQQLVMESNGKSVRLDGSPVDRPTSAILWGGTGTDAQHAVFQLLHQGTHLVPVEFVAVAEGTTSRTRPTTANCSSTASRRAPR
jgi:glucose-6-phosphate isomerase